LYSLNFNLFSNNTAKNGAIEIIAPRGCTKDGAGPLFSTHRVGSIKLPLLR